MVFLVYLPDSDIVWPMFTRSRIQWDETFVPLVFRLVTGLGDLQFFHLNNLAFYFGSYNLFFQFLEVDENARLGSEGPDLVKRHPWFTGIDWNGIRNCNFPVPQEITARITQHFESRTEDFIVPHDPTSQDIEELNTPEWLEDW